MTKATFIEKVNIRDKPTTVNSIDKGDVNVNDVIYGTVSGSWIAFTAIYRALPGGHVKEVFPSTFYAAVTEPTNPTRRYATVEEIDEPTTPTEPTPPNSTVKPIKIVISGNDYRIGEIVATADGGLSIDLLPKD
jgi:hypothetical protein